MAGDRISEAYEGKISEGAQVSSKKRIDWFCDQISENNILDIGCSQGILPILLGRKGLIVTGIDNDEESINYAKDMLSKENDDVKYKVKFICDDFLEYDFGDKKFAVIVMGEVLEHLDEPLVFLKKASSLLMPEGKFIVSVPFGINRHPDHKRTYYFYNFYKQVNQYFSVEEVIYMGKWIAFKAVSKNNNNAKAITLDDSIFQEYENAVLDLDVIRETEKNELKDKLVNSYEYNKSLKEEKKDLAYKYNIVNTELKSKINIENIYLKEIEKKEKIFSQKLEEKEEIFSQKLEKKEEIFSKKLEEKEEIYNKKIEEKEKIFLQKLEEKINIINEIKNQNEKYEKDILIYKRKLKESKKISKDIEKKYNILSKSKFGRLQIKYWNFRSKTKYGLKGIKYRIRETAKKSPLLCEIVWKYRERNKKSILLPQTNAIPMLPENNKLSKLNAAQRRQRFEENTDKNYFESIKEILDKIPESNGGRYYEKHNYKIGIVADEFLYAAFKDAADFVFITPENWKEAVNGTDFLLMVSAWRGLNEEWRGAAQENSPNRQLIYDIIDEYKNQNKITVFYSKEDPPNYNSFLGIAKKCDYIFTTCAEVVENYKRDCENDNVNVLCFGINPLYHNPVGFKNPFKKDGVIFSGSWMTKYPERLNDMRMLFDGVLEGNKDLKIIDRNYNYTRSEIYRYPEEYWKYVSPSIDHTLLQKVHKLYNWALNINTVTASTTMFANRGYELQAAGNLLISNYSVGVNNKLPMIYTVTDKFEIGQILNGYSDDDLYRRQVQAIRSVMTGETAFDRVGQVIETIGLEKNKNERHILVVANKINDDMKEIFDRQSYQFKKLISEDELNDKVLSECDMIAFFNSDMDYGMFYLEDMSNGFKYTDSSYITKDGYLDGNKLVEGKEHDYVNVMKNKYVSVFWSKDFTAEQLKNFNGEVVLENGYSIDHFNFNAQKYSIEKKKEFKLSVIVPVYNNGKQLLGKAFSSLQRSSMFTDMEILLVDDGSTDGYTDKLVKHLERTYSNVRAYLFNDGGSGSASRPRNKGVEIASSDYVTYLDPDNEAIFDGYTKLYNLSTENNYDITVGNMLKLTTEILDAKYYRNFEEKYGSDIIVNDTKNYMEKTNFSPMSIQAMVIKKSVITDSGITQPVGAAGQDTLFCWELFFNANTIKAINLPIHIYYAAVEGSTVNSIGKRFFEKYYLIEGPRREALEKYGVLGLYMKQRYNYYFINWTLKKLSQAKNEEADECAEIVYKMHKIYEDVYLNNSKVINEFVEKCENDYSFMKK